MKKLVLILALIVWLPGVKGWAVDNYLHTEDMLTFDNVGYRLGWSSHPNDIQYLQEYFPEGQTAESFTDMLSVWLFFVDLPAEQWIQRMADSYAARKGTDPACHFETYENDGEYMFDCLRSEEGMTAVEFNVYRCRNVKVDGRDALLICFYTGDAYGDDIKPFLTRLKERRGQLIEAMIGFEMPEVSLK